MENESYPDEDTVMRDLLKSIRVMTKGAESQNRKTPSFKEVPVNQKYTEVGMVIFK